ncbi:MAG: Carbon storage regulator [Phycisphaerae bacterium]|nr:Carbon storage regulator [Phycisphaerae bacterium]
MLVLSRTCDEAIMIGDDIRVTVVDIRGDKVRLGVTAPRHVKVHRQEVFDAIQRENLEAARLEPGQIGVVFEGCVEAGPAAGASIVEAPSGAIETSVVRSRGREPEGQGSRARQSAPRRRMTSDVECAAKG